jgi:hypothetical protein
MERDLITLVLAGNYVHKCSVFEGAYCSSLDNPDYPSAVSEVLRWLNMRSCVSGESPVFSNVRSESGFLCPFDCSLYRLIADGTLLQTYS